MLLSKCMNFYKDGTKHDQSPKTNRLKLYNRCYSVICCILNKTNLCYKGIEISCNNVFCELKQSEMLAGKRLRYYESTGD